MATIEELRADFEQALASAKSPEEWDALYDKLGKLERASCAAIGTEPLPGVADAKRDRAIEMFERFGPVAMQAIEAYLATQHAQQQNYGVASLGTTIANLAQSLAHLKDARATRVTMALETAIIRLTNSLVPPEPAADGVSNG